MDRAELKRLVLASGCAVASGDAIFLCDPHASAAELTEMQALMAQPPVKGELFGGGWLGVRTGGTGGRVKFARHDEATVRAAVRGFCAHFSLQRIHAVGVLPLHHVSGLLAHVRCVATGGRYLPWDWKRLEAGDLPVIASFDEEWVLSLVPTQLQRLITLPSAVDWLRRFRVIFVGGGPLWADLADTAARHGLRLAISYGMTETAAMVTATRPEEFLAGDRTCGMALPHARVTLTDAGLVRIAGESVYRGYWPEWNVTREFVTEDLAQIDDQGRLHVFGRRDAMIISGGKKILPVDVEAGLRASGEFEDVAVFGLPDSEWGEIVVACYPAAQARAPDLARAGAALSAHQRPKRVIPIADWPRNPQGKINRAALLALAVSAVAPMQEHSKSTGRTLPSGPS